MEKDRGNTQREMDDLMAQVDQETKAKANYDKSVKTLEMQLADLNAKADEQARQLNELSSWKSRVTNENADLQRQLEDSESQLNQMSVRRTLTYVLNSSTNHFIACQRRYCIADRRGETQCRRGGA